MASTNTLAFPISQFAYTRAHIEKTLSGEQNHDMLINTDPLFAYAVQLYKENKMLKAMLQQKNGEENDDATR